MLIGLLDFYKRYLVLNVLDKSPRDPKNQAFVTGVPDIEVTIAYMKFQNQLFEFMQYGGKAQLQHYKPRMVDAGHFHFCLMVDDVEAAVEACKAYDTRITTLSPQ